MKNFRILTEDLFAGIARRAQECFIHIFDPGVEIGDGDAFRALFDRKGEFANLIGESQLLGNIAHSADAVCQVHGKLLEKL